MTDMTSPETASQARTPTGMALFFRRYDRRNRLVLGAGLVSSLVLSAIIGTRLHDVTERLHAIGAPGLKGLPMMWGMGVVFSPAVMASWWAFTELLAHGRHKIPALGGPASPTAVDQRNGVRIANAGFLYVLALVGGLITEQLLMGSMVFGISIPGELIARGMCVVTGGVTIYLGNLWPRMPTPRSPERTAVARMKANRFSGWLLVIVGLAIVALGVFLPLLVHHRP